MSGDEARRTGFDARMRLHFEEVDTAPGFEARVLARVASLSAVPAAELRVRYEQRRSRALKNFTREAWLNAATAAGIGVAALALIWSDASAVAAWVRDAAGAGNLTILGCTVLAAGLWPFLQKLLPR